MASNLLKGLLISTALGAAGCSLTSDYRAPLPELVNQEIAEIIAKTRGEHTAKPAKLTPQIQTLTMGDYDTSPPNEKEVVAKYSNLGEAVSLATPESHPEQLNMLVQLVNKANKTFGTNHNLPMLFIMDEPAERVRESLPSNGGYMVFSKDMAQDPNLNGFMSHELGHLHLKRDSKAIDTLLFETWHEACSKSEQKSVEKEWDKAAQTTASNSFLGSTMLALGDLRTKIYNRLESKWSVSGECAQGVTDSIHKASTIYAAEELNADTYGAIIGGAKELSNDLAKETRDEENRRYYMETLTPAEQKRLTPSPQEIADTITIYPTRLERLDNVERVAKDGTDAIKAILENGSQNTNHSQNIAKEKPSTRER
jgi:hypothetical protein